MNAEHTTLRDRLAWLLKRRSLVSTETRMRAANAMSAAALDETGDDRLRAAEAAVTVARTFEEKTAARDSVVDLVMPRGLNGTRTAVAGELCGVDSCRLKKEAANAVIGWEYL